MADTPHDTTTIEQTDEQPVVVPRRKYEEEADMDITPMIDITFLLLIFFLVAARLDQGNQVRQPEARHGTAVSQKTAAVITVEKIGPEETAIYLGDGINPATRVAPGDMEAQQNDLVDYLSKELDGGKQHVLLKAEGQVINRVTLHLIAGAVGRIGPDVEFYSGVMEVK